MSFSLPDAMAVGLSKYLSKSEDCTAFVAMHAGQRFYFAGIIGGDLRWMESQDEVEKSEFLERSSVIPWSALPLSQQVMIGFALAAWMQNQATSHGLPKVVVE